MLSHSQILDGIFDDDLTKEEHKQMQKDVDYILSKVEMYNVVDSDDDEEQPLSEVRKQLISKS